MKNFLKKLYEDFPELKNDKEKVDKLVYFLNENKPNIEVSENFRLNLKNRIDSYIGLKHKKKNKFLIFALPIFSFCFVLFGVSYFLGLDKVDDKNLISINTFDEENSLKEKTQISRMMIFDSDEEESLDENTNLGGSIEDEDLKIETKKAISIKTENEIIYDYSQEEKIEISKDNFIEEEYFYDENEFEKEEKIERKQENSKNVNDSSGSNEQEIAYYDSNDDYSGEEEVMSMTMSMFMDASFYEEINFNDYCDQNSGKFIEYENENNEKLYKCIIEEKTCLEEKYSNGSCEFEEK